MRKKIIESFGGNNERIKTITEMMKESRFFLRICIIAYLEKKYKLSSDWSFQKRIKEGIDNYNREIKNETRQ